MTTLLIAKYVVLILLAFTVLVGIIASIWHWRLSREVKNRRREMNELVQEIAEVTGYDPRIDP